MNYDLKFYNDQKEISNQSAKYFVPYIINIFKPNSVLDVGCGIGTWLKVFKENGVSQILGIDGTWVNKNQLLINENEFIQLNFNKKNRLSKKYDLLICMEVAEHLKKSSAVKFVDFLTNHSDVVIFSAAIPFQGGTNHFNEQWQSFWFNLFKKNGFVGLDILRPPFWNNGNIDTCYLQNTIVYVNKNSVQNKKLIQKYGSDFIIDLVHPEMYSRKTIFINKLIKKIPKILRKLGMVFLK